MILKIKHKLHIASQGEKISALEREGFTPLFLISDKNNGKTCYVVQEYKVNLSLSMLLRHTGGINM
jgi:hypothetical protein